MRKLSPRENALLGLLTASAIIWLWWTAAHQGGPSRAQLAEAEKARKAQKAQATPVVRMDLLVGAHEGYDESGRDLFKFAQRPPSAEEIRPMEAQALQARKTQEAIDAQRRLDEERFRQQQAEQAALAASQPPPPPPPPQPPAITFNYVGYLGPKNDRIAVFEDGENVVLAKKGERLREEFKVMDIRYESVVLGYTRKEFKDQTRELMMARR